MAIAGCIIEVDDRSDIIAVGRLTFAIEEVAEVESAAHGGDNLLPILRM
jgi:hypothetical protein